MSDKLMETCPCGSGQSYLHCCEMYISGKKPAPTPETLMRSRYSAYTKANIDYIMRTMQGPAAKDFDQRSALSWAQQAQWLGLKVLATRTEQNQGWVEFIATYAWQGEKHNIHELSEFQLVEGRWYYVNGKQQNSL